MEKKSSQSLNKLAFFYRCYTSIKIYLMLRNPLNALKNFETKIISQY